MMTMQQHPDEWPSPTPAPASSTGRSLLLLGAATVVMVLGSLGGYYASSFTDSAPQTPYRSVPLVPVPIDHDAVPSAPVLARPTPLTPLEPSALPAGAPGEVQPPGGSAPAAPAGGAGAPPAEAVVAPPAVAAQPSAEASAEPVVNAAAPGGEASGHKVHPILAHDPLPDGNDGALGEGAKAMRRRLEERMASGQATAKELTMLKAICQHQGDAACKEKAQAALRKLSD
jgi:Rieske Fe-S protein